MYCKSKDINAFIGQKRTYCVKYACIKGIIRNLKNFVYKEKLKEATVYVSISDIFHCPSPGIHSDRKSCDSYYVCIMAGQQWKLYRMNCPTGLGFDDKSRACVVNSNCIDKRNNWK